MTPRTYGIILFVVAVVIVLVYGFLPKDPDGRDPIVALLAGPSVARVEVMGFIGGEKVAFLENEEVRDILTGRYGVHIDVRKAGSIEMVSDQTLLAQSPDVLWPGSQHARDIAMENGVAIKSDEIIFNSPIVMFSWTPIAEALEARGLATPIDAGGAAWSVDTAAFLEMVEGPTTWDGLGVADLYSTVMVYSTDPARSNSGNQFAALMVSVFESMEADGTAEDRAAEIIRRMGYKSRSSGDLFEEYLRTGLAKPIIVGYESQLIEFALARPNDWAALEGRAIRPVILYPEPSVFSSHIMLALTDDGRQVIEALKDEELQTIAWRDHGFRSGFAGTVDTSALPVQGIPASLGKIVPMPPVATVQRVVAASATE